jgi:hypothetical protein
MLYDFGGDVSWCLIYAVAKDWNLVTRIHAISGVDR